MGTDDQHGHGRQQYRENDRFARLARLGGCARIERLR
jgi:hypothetical protein